MGLKFSWNISLPTKQLAKQLAAIFGCLQVWLKHLEGNYYLLSYKSKE